MTAMPANAATPNTSNNSEPKIPPSPISESITKDEIKLTQNSGAIVAPAMNVAAATSYTQRR